MTKQEILNLINAKIKGQGSQVDAGGALPSILSAILDLVDGGSGALTFVPLTDWASESISEAEAATKYGLTPEEWEKLSSGKYTYLATGSMGDQGFPIVVYNDSAVIADYLVKTGETTLIDSYVRIQRNTGQGYVISIHIE